MSLRRLPSQHGEVSVMVFVENRSYYGVPYIEMNHRILPFFPQVRLLNGSNSSSELSSPFGLAQFQVPAYYFSFLSSVSNVL